MFGLVSSPEAESILAGVGAEAVTANALDAAFVKAAIRRIPPDAVINQ